MKTPLQLAFAGVIALAALAFACIWHQQARGEALRAQQRTLDCMQLAATIQAAHQDTPSKPSSSGTIDLTASIIEALQSAGLDQERITRTAPSGQADERVGLSLREVTLKEAIVFLHTLSQNPARVQDLRLLSPKAGEEGVRWTLETTLVAPTARTSTLSQ